MKHTVLRTVCVGALGGVLALTGCTTGSHTDHAGHDGAASSDTAPSGTPTEASHEGSHTEDAMDHAAMGHPMDGGPAPAGIAEAGSPTYPVGTSVVLEADHMEGMKGAAATISGAYDTFAYAVDYTPTTGGEPVRDHRWVVQEEIADAGTERLADGTEVVLEAEHMEGMTGAHATVVAPTDETVYMVDLEADGMRMTQHKWVVESEISPAG